MQSKLLQWLLGGVFLSWFLITLEILIAKLIFNNNTYDFIMGLITIFIYVIIAVIKFVKYQKYVKKHQQEQVENASKELSTEFKQVFLNSSKSISKDLFNCQAIVDNDGKIICQIQLDYEMKFENYEDFLSFFHFSQD